MFAHKTTLNINIKYGKKEWKKIFLRDATFNPLTTNVPHHIE